MSAATSSRVEASKQGVIVICFTEWENGVPVLPERQTSPRFIVIDVNGPPVVRFTGDSAAEAFGFLQSEEGRELALFSDGELDADYLVNAFGVSTLSPVEVSSGFVEGKVEIVDPLGDPCERQFSNSFVQAGMGISPLSGGVPAFTILHGADSFEQLRSLRGRIEPKEALPTRRGPRLR